MQELSQRLKESLVNHLMDCQDLDEPYLYSNNKKWTKREIAEEIKNETEFGIKNIRNIMILSLDLMSRKKKP